MYVPKFSHMCQNHKTSIIGKFPLYFIFYFGMKTYMCKASYSWPLNSRFELCGSSYKWIFFFFSFNSKYCSISPSTVGWIHTSGTVDMEEPNTWRVYCKFFKLLFKGQLHLHIFFCTTLVIFNVHTQKLALYICFNICCMLIYLYFAILAHNFTHLYIFVCPYFYMHLIFFTRFSQILLNVALGIANMILHF